MKLIREEFGVALWTTDNGDGYYVTGVNHEKGQVYSIRRRDHPIDGGRFFGRISDAGVRYVAHPIESRQSAMASYRREVKQAKLYVTM